MTSQPHWPAEHCTALQRLIETEGLNARLAALALNEQFGSGYSRCAAIGRARRMGLKMAKNGKGGRVGPKGGPSQRKKREKALVPQTRPETIRFAPKQRFPAVQTEPQVDTTIPRRVSLLELTDETCRWPISTPGAPDFCFCGNPPLAGIPYCGGHARLAFRVDQRRG